MFDEESKLTWDKSVEITVGVTANETPAVFIVNVLGSNNLITCDVCFCYADMQIQDVMSKEKGRNGEAELKMIIAASLLDTPFEYRWGDVQMPISGSQPWNDVMQLEEGAIPGGRRG